MVNVRALCIVFYTDDGYGFSNYYGGLSGIDAGCGAGERVGSI